MATWFNRLDPKEIPTGDRPYGAFWLEIENRPTPLHVAQTHRVDDAAGNLVEWVFDGWFLDPKVAHNEPIDAQIDALERAQPPTLRAQRELALTVGALPNPPALNTIITKLEAALNELRVSAGLPSVNVGRLPDLMKNDGMKKAAALDLAIRALRDQRIP